MRRLKTRSQFQTVLAGDTLARTAHFVLHRAPLASATCERGCAMTATQAELTGCPSCSGGWIGAVVPKRLARRAVTRNTIRRQIYSAGANARVGLARAAHIVRLRASFEKGQFVSASSEKLKDALRQELQQLFTKAGLSEQLARLDAAL